MNPCMVKNAPGQIKSLAIERMIISKIAQNSICLTERERMITLPCSVVQPCHQKNERDWLHPVLTWMWFI